jgi:arylsulfatase A-like enzyme
MQAPRPLAFPQTSLWFTTICSIASLLAFLLTPADAAGPNIIVIVSDDHRHDALGVVQRELGDRANFPFFKSPQLDRLAAGGVRFRNGFVTHSLCSPSRATMLSGLHTHEHGITSNEQPFIAKDTWPHVLSANGWKTAYFGKWHMGDQRERPGFQETATYLNQGSYIDCKFVVNGKNTPSKGWVDDVSTDYAVEFIRRSTGTPFAMYLGFKAPHDKRVAAERHHATYSNVILKKPTNWNVPAPWAKDAGWDWDNRHADRITYFQALAGMDDNVGRVLDVLDELHLAENTLILYMGDNGYYLGEHGLGDKRTAYEQSIRIPYLIRFPAAFKPAVRDELVLNLDAAATILDACGLKPTWKQHGVSLMPLLKARPGSAPWRNSFLYQNYKDPAFPKVTFDVLAVRTKTHKYVENDANPEWTQLFDLTTDPSENRNLTGSPGASGILAEMKAELSRLKEQSGFRPPLSQVK